MNKLLTLACVVLFGCGFAVTAYAQSDATKEVDTARAHAAMAQGAPSVAKAHMHLHHVINCLVGPDGEAFDPDSANPCKDQGNGAIPDAGDNAAVTTRLNKALAAALSGLQADDLDTVHKQAAGVAAALAVTSSE